MACAKITPIRARNRLELAKIFLASAKPILHGSKTILANGKMILACAGNTRAHAEMIPTDSDYSLKNLNDLPEIVGNILTYAC